MNYNIISVHGLTTMTLTLFSTSLLNAWLNPSIPHLEAQYSVITGEAIRPCGDDTFITRPEN